MHPNGTWISTYRPIKLAGTRGGNFKESQTNLADRGSFVYGSLRLQLASKLASGVSTSNSARPILSKRFLAWFISDSAPWARPLKLHPLTRRERNNCGLARAAQA